MGTPKQILKEENVAYTLETDQTKLKLTGNAEVLTTLRNKKLLVKDGEGKEYFARPFDSQEIRFYPGVPQTFPASIARALIQGSRVIIGDAFTGPQVEALENIGTAKLGTIQSEAPRPATECPYCHKDFATAGKLGYHLMHTPKEGDEAHPAREEAEEGAAPVGAKP